MLHTLLDQFATFMGSIYAPSLIAASAIATFMKVLSIHDWPYRIIGLFFTRKFQPAKKSVQWNTTILRSIFQCSALRAVLFKALSRSLNTKTRAGFPRRNCTP